MSAFNEDSTTEEVIAGVSLANKVALVTGASSGLGTQTCLALAQAGATVVMTARSEEALLAAQETVLDAVPEANTALQLMDLSDFDSIRQSCNELLANYPTIDLLINNAGVMFCPLSRTAQGNEMQFGTNHLGHFLMAGLLAPALLNSGSARVIALSSGGHKLAPVNLQDPNYESREYDKWIAYGESKTANALFAVALDARLKNRGVRAFSVHPGVIMTNLSRHMLPEDYEQMGTRFESEGELKFKSVSQGAATSVWAATSAGLEGTGGIYLEDCHIADPAVPGQEGGVEAYAQDSEVAQQLWSLSEKLVGQTFAF